MSESDFPVRCEQFPFLLERDSIQLVPDPVAPYAVLRSAYECWGTQAVVRRRDFPFCLLALVVAGRALIRTPAAAHELEPGRICVVPKGTEFVMGILRPLELRIVVATGSAMHRMADEHLGSRISSWAAADAAAFERICVALHEAARAGGPFVQSVCDDFHRILLRTAHLGRLRGAASPSGALATFARAKAIIDEDPLQAPTVAALARRLGIDRSHLARLFMRFCRTGPAAYAARHRLAQAAELLAGGSSVGDAAEACGYADAFSFSKAFSRRYGVPPSSWMRR